MVVFIDGAAHSTQAVVTVGQSIRDGKFLHAGGAGLLNDAYISNVVRHHCIKSDTQILGIAGYIVSLKNAPSHSAFPCFLLGNRCGFTGNAVY